MRAAPTYPVIAIHGPRQSGKSTLAQQACPDLPLVRLEDPAEQALMRADWRGFFLRHPDGAIIDEAQLVPELLSALQARVKDLGIDGKTVEAWLSILEHGCRSWRLHA